MKQPDQPEKMPITEDTHEQGERLARFLAHAGIASRRHAEALIAAGRVQVNGLPVTTQGTRIDPRHDRVSVDGKPVQAATQQVYVLLHKPVGHVSTAHDPQGRPTVMDLLPPALRNLRVYPVGRLDRDSSGLLLLTNDGDFALQLSHPRYAMEKRYEALVQGHPVPTALQALRDGVTFTEDDGTRHTSAPAQVGLLRHAGNDTWLALTIHEGRKRQIRRMLMEVGHPVLQLRRVGIGSLTLEHVPVGKWRYLTDAEVASLRK
ncbi:MAG: rRNA pseudouridine synthase [Chloroflexi bacterium]|nr:MAG: rRNA pseudouridine synthase [Chloroflexota bacterium]